MSAGTIFRCGLLLAACVLAGSGVAQASIVQSQPAKGAIPDILGPDGLNGYYNRNPEADQDQVTKTITLNFGPLHFQEILRSTPRTCHS